MKVENKYKVHRLEYNASAFVFCPLGKDWGRVEIKAEIYPAAWLPDYVDVDNFIVENLEGSTHITEEVGYLVFDFLVKMLEPVDLRVTVHSVNDSMHSCYTTIAL